LGPRPLLHTLPRPSLRPPAPQRIDGVEVPAFDIARAHRILVEDALAEEVVGDGLHFSDLRRQRTDGVVTSAFASADAAVAPSSVSMLSS
jgi:hypothetical protein